MYLDGFRNLQVMEGLGLPSSLERVFIMTVNTGAEWYGKNCIFGTSTRAALLPGFAAKLTSTAKLCLSRNC